MKVRGYEYSQRQKEKKKVKKGGKSLLVPSDHVSHAVFNDRSDKNI